MKYQFQIPISCTTCGYRNPTNKCTNPELVLPGVFAPRIPGRHRPPPETTLAWNYCDGAFWTETEDE